jgi:hypothetical protein
MKEEIGTAAGSIGQALNTKGELPLAQLKKEVKAKAPLFEALFPNPLETRARKGDGRLLGLIVFLGENSANAC